MLTLKHCLSVLPRLNGKLLPSPRSAMSTVGTKDLPPVLFQDVLDAKQRIEGKVHRTQLLTSSILDKKTGRQLFFKAENLQKTGSFKVRGALNMIKALKEKGEILKGVVTHSSGNHGQALAWAASLENIPCAVVAPEYCPAGKRTSIESYGAELHICPSTAEDRVKAMERVRDELGYTFVSPHDHPLVIAGQGTIGLELLEEIPDLDAILVAVSGGGLASGIATAVKHLNPKVKVFCVEPEGKHLEPSLRAGESLWEMPPKLVDTIADAIRLQAISPNNMKILPLLVEKDVFTTTDEEMIEAMKLVFHHMKVVVEAAAGATVAAALSQKMTQLPADIKKVAVILCGGNIDIDNLPWVH